MSEPRGLQSVRPVASLGLVCPILGSGRTDWAIANTERDYPLYETAVQIVQSHPVITNVKIHTFFSLLQRVR